MLSSLLHRNGETQQDLVDQAHRVATLLGPPGGRVVLSCRHARSYVPGLLGAWLSGATVELLPNVQAGTLDRVDADPLLTHVLHDDPARQERSPKAIYVPAVLDGEIHGHVVPGLPKIAVRMTTSGTTERPRYIEKTMAQLLAELDVLATLFAPATCMMSTVPLSHLYGLLFGALLPLKLGAKIVSHEALLPADVATVIEREGVDLMISTPAHLRAMADAPMPRGLRVVTSGARMPGELHVGLTTAHGWQVTDVLGSTETGGIATRTHPLQPWTPMPGVTVTAPDGGLVVESPWSPPTPIDDQIELLPGGTFRYLGRNTELVKIAGKRAHAHELEATLRTLPGITDVAVLVHASEGREARVAIAVVGNVAREDIAAAIRRQFDAVFVPKIIKLVTHIPRTDRGKVDPEALRALLGLSLGPATTEIPVRKLGPGQYVADVPRDLVFFRGHFDSFPILPGTVIIERVVWPVVKAEHPDVAMLRALRRLRFRQPVMPDSQLAISLTGDKPRLLFEVTCAQAVVASGQLLVE
ncbi:xanthomonadin biosynthesis 3-hydroxybenozate--AMP ligase XanA2 [soil metagenome]